EPRDVRQRYASVMSLKRYRLSERRARGMILNTEQGLIRLDHHPGAEALLVSMLEEREELVRATPRGRAQSRVRVRDVPSQRPTGGHGLPLRDQLSERQLHRNRHLVMRLEWR